MAGQDDKIKRRDLRIAWNSNAFWSQSGYGVFSRDLVTRLHKDGWPIACIDFYGHEGNAITVDGILHYGKMGDPFGSDALLHHGKDFGANVFMSMQDVWTLDPNFLQQMPVWIPYTPVDKYPLPGQILERLRYAYKILTFSKFGYESLLKQGYTSTLIYEGTDTNIFKPLDKSLTRKELGLPEDGFIFGSIAANKENPPRKGFQEMLDAFKLFYDNHKDAYLYFHTQQTAPGNFPILEYARYLGFGEHTYFLDQYKATYKADSTMVCKELNTFDVNLHPSQTEGFGLGIIESQSCGIPVIINRCHSMPELVVDNKTGWIAEPEKGRWTSENSYVFPVDVKSLYDKMELAYKTLHETNTIAKDARENIVNNFNIDTIFEKQWIPFFEDLQEGLLPKVDTITEKVDNK
jgi:glycosyltransferase involved in cell wall biosynthesis